MIHKFGNLKFQVKYKRAYHISILVDEHLVSEDQMFCQHSLEKFLEKILLYNFNRKKIICHVNSRAYCLLATKFMTISSKIIIGNLRSFQL